MNNKLTERAAALLREGTVAFVLGFEQGSKGTRPFFCHRAEDADRLVLDEETCTNNLAVYLTKKELIGGQRVGVTATLPVLRSYRQLVREHQINEEQFVMLAMDGEEPVDFANRLDALDEFLQNHPRKPRPDDAKLLAKIEAMSREERWNYWTETLTKCVKCYACRAACPLCYCTRCIVEVNRPQWIEPWAAPLSNAEWQISRVMHMAGRCSGCGACGEACPVDLPIHLLTMRLQQTVRREFGEWKQGNALSTFSPDDKENFIR